MKVDKFSEYELTDSLVNKQKIIYEIKQKDENKNTDISTNNNKESNLKISKEKISDIKFLTNIISKENPQFFEEFEIKDHIGHGGESQVYKGIYKKYKKPITFKLILRNSRNLKEIKILKKLKNENIINCYGYNEIIKNKVDCIIMEYGKFNLRNFQIFLRRNILSETLLCFLSYQILKGLKYCYICKIAHLDLKPQNIIIDDNLCVKLIDFSISIDYNKINTDKIKLPLKGTCVYVAPEVLSSKIINIKDINKVDLYALGMILYRLAFGTYCYGLNYKDDNFNKIYEKVEKENLEFKNENIYSSYFIDFLKKLLEKDIDKRINIYEAMNHYWIKGANILFEEKEKVYNKSHFLINLITDNIKNFNDYIHI